MCRKVLKYEEKCGRRLTREHGPITHAPLSQRGMSPGPYWYRVGLSINVMNSCITCRFVSISRSDVACDFLVSEGVLK